MHSLQAWRPAIGALKAATEGVRIPANHKASACIKDILEGAAADAYLQHATVKATFEVQVLAERSIRQSRSGSGCWMIPDACH